MLIDFIPDALIRSLSGGLAVLTSMITPALLISASGMFILSTSNRLGRVIDRVRRLSELIEQVMQAGQRVELLEERKAVYFQMIALQSRRARLLARSLMIFYIATGMFVATSVTIGLVTVVNPTFVWVPVVLGISGAFLLLAGSVTLIFEARMALATLTIETAFLDKLVEFHYKDRLTV